MFDIKATPLPDYSRREDIVNAITHFLGVPFCIIAMGFLLKLQVSRGANATAVASTCLYLISTLIVFACSGIYHILKPSFGKKVARLIDHSDIYLMISGTVTAFILPYMTESNRKSSLGIIIAIWALSAIGIFLTFVDLKKFNTVQIFMYVFMGWTAIFGMRSIYRVGDVGKAFVITVLIGGLFITVGAFLYFIGKKKRYFHAVFHVCVLMGTVVIFVGNYNYGLATLA